jgi:hypothetical protein
MLEKLSRSRISDLEKIRNALVLLALVLAVWAVGSRTYHAPQLPENAFCEEKYMLRHQGDAK